ncbi:hypothetical protein [Paremcibacter congregatus]|uniref:Uncharacterized protein n=1 Tax=Paremcibacter congregatus TaxID=2043170 RepID=A0A2G4YNS6_9PROT|nr:hypothetical protein [Paremcibacter congregatus]PHZ83982.1 hypothetical protein CRD36_14325 [Paremcibacter congregatus]QDE25924.1 hypothetical protein FIV45_00830 [Paremcibacter congregatus]
MKKTFEISVFNEKVRADLEAGRRHKTLESSWADVHLIEIQADDETTAIAACMRKHPARMGFILGPALQIT